MSKHYKYPRTLHLPWSPGASADDVRLGTVSNFEGREVVITEKLDGENTSMYRDHIHARSLSSQQHPSRNWVKQLHGQIAHDIPEQWRICGENVYAQHSIIYDNLQSYFYVFSIWDESNRCLAWDKTIEWAELFGLVVAPVLYRGVWNEEIVRDLEIDTNICEGYVVRNSEAFAYEDFGSNVAKWVRLNHVQTDQHWMFKEVVANKLKG